MIGARLHVDSDRRDYVHGLLIDEGLVPDETFEVAGGSEFNVDEAAWAALDPEVHAEIARFARPGTTAEFRAPDVVDTQPAGEADRDQAAPLKRGSRGGRSKSTSSTTTKGAR